MDWGRSQIHIRYQDPGRGTSWIVRVPCFLCTVPDPEEDGRMTIMLRDKVFGRVVGIVCEQENMHCYSYFMEHALAAAREDGSIFEPSGELYAAVVGAFVTADSHHVFVRTDIPGGKFFLDYAHDGLDGSY